ncbi:MAG: pyridoxal phosphate-dependent aminotransferase, partial [Alphaproteobacteria bacterium]|nr:pyridoxal phosphate-dependent aminotransferase [Alphaproteobacteria bacterium]
EERVFIRMPGVAPLNRCIRVSVGTAQERTRFGEALGRVLARLAR